MTPLTTEQVIGLAPDGASAKAAQGLVKPAKWVSQGAFDGGLWGECQGSGAKPYQVMVDANGLGTKCSCPSRKFPCKHGLALMLMFAGKTGSFATTPPIWMTEWLDGRKERAEKQAAKKEAAADAPPPDPALVAKRQEARLGKMQAGGKFLTRWMQDLIRDGLADLPSRPSSFWTETAARMVDAQAPGLGRRVEEMNSLLYSAGHHWPQSLVAALGRTQLLIDALENFPQLPSAMQMDVRVALGWALDKEMAAGGTSVADTWTVLAVAFDESGPLCERRVWLHGKQSERPAYLLDFAHGGRKFERAFFIGTQFTGTVAYFPSAWEQRAIITQSDASTLAGTGSLGHQDETLDAALEAASIATAANPWLQRLPMSLRDVRLTHSEAGWGLIDSSGAAVPIKWPSMADWRCAAIAPGEPLHLIGEWTGHFAPLTAILADGCWHNLAA